MLHRLFQVLVLSSALVMLGLVFSRVYRRNDLWKAYSQAPDETTSNPRLFKVTENFWKLDAPGARLTKAAGMEPCPDTPPDLVGPLQVEFETNRTLDGVTQKYGSFLQLGGRYKPPNCISRQKVAIIIPFRNRYEHLNHWLYYLHPILMRQQLDYGVYVINQDGDGVYNKAKLMNAGHIEALKEYDYDCFLFSDVDMVPLDDRNLYRCFDSPRHLAVGVDKFNFILPYKNIFGGVTSLSKEQFRKINGFSNTFWGWGGEDDDISNRIMIQIRSISRPDSMIGRYKMIKHERDPHNEVNPKSPGRLHRTVYSFRKDGLNSLTYTVKHVRRERLFTFITVDVHVPSILSSFLPADGI